MDRNSIIGFILIAIVFVIWMLYSGNQTPDQRHKGSVSMDSSLKTSNRDGKTNNMFDSSISGEPLAIDSLKERQVRNKFGEWFGSLQKGNDELFTIETDKYIVIFSTHGGGIKKWTLKNFSMWNGYPLQLIDRNLASDANILFGTFDGKLIDTKELFFSFSDVPKSRYIKLSDSSSFEFQAFLNISQSSAAIIKKFVVRNGGYSIDFDIVMKNMGSIIANSEYQVTINSLALTEYNSVSEASFAEADALVNNDRIKLNATDPTEKYQENIAGDVHWVSTHNKYFINALITRNEFKGSGVYLEGKYTALPNDGARKIYQASIKVPYNSTQYEASNFTLFIGPMEYELLKSQHDGLEQVLSLGWAWIVRPFSEYLIIPMFHFLHSFIPNYGIVIILFTLIIKLLLYPLTKSSMQSMKKMQSIQPLIADLREKFKDDQQKQNAEMMKLYKDYGINPAGGCLPMLLQMPILFALFTIFQSIIELRQKPFIWWIDDLSAPDIAFSLPITLPILGTSAISGLALAMGITMFIQQKQSVKDPRQKAMVYVMPVMFWLMFNGFPSGLNLYYFMFNLLSIGQQYIINRSSEGTPLQKISSNKKSKKGWAERAIASLEQKAKAQKSLKKR